jgi:hypothetical protein
MPFLCPLCRKISHNPNDEREGYCGVCHAFTGAVLTLTEEESHFHLGQVPEMTQVLEAERFPTRRNGHRDD